MLQPEKMIINIYGDCKEIVPGFPDRIISLLGSKWLSSGAFQKTGKMSARRPEKTSQFAKWIK
ncbi:MAG: hypothetical protein C4522_10345 [Desulfobacteraceae bacterium]|nr:MAG: hypothetical protein C4522_10345 [Desulfobacteraceae bacterium]